MDKKLSTRGRKFTGIVISDKMSRTVTVEWERRKFIKKYERYEKRRTRIKAHTPDSVGAEKGDVVQIEETRPISKTKNFLVTKIIKKLNANE
jgi:small subunit ribosomal protein S17